MRRRRRAGGQYANLETVGLGAGDRTARRLPPLLWLLASTGLLLAVARPQATLTLPSRVDTVILALVCRAA